MSTGEEKSKEGRERGGKEGEKGKKQRAEGHPTGGRVTCALLDWNSVAAMSPIDISIVTWTHFELGRYLSC
jgi:hypothetical protein